MQHAPFFLCNIQTDSITSFIHLYTKVLHKLNLKIHDIIWQPKLRDFRSTETNEEKQDKGELEWILSS